MVERFDSSHHVSLARPEFSMVETGQPAPDFTLPDQSGREVTLSELRGYPESPGGAKASSLGRQPQVDRSIPHDRAGSPRRATEPQETAGFLSPLRGSGEGRDHDVGPSWGSRPRHHPAAPFGAKTTSRTVSRSTGSMRGQP